MLLRRSAVVALAVALGAAAAEPALAAAPDTTASPAGPVTGAIVIFSPAFGTGAAGVPVAPSPLLAPLSPTRGQLPPLPAPLLAPLSPARPASPLPAILVTAPTSTGSLLIPLQVPAGSGTGPALTQLQLVIPGPNPSQNTPIALSQLLDMVLRSMQPAGAPGASTPGSLVSVFATTPP